MWNALPDVFARIGALSINALIEAMERGLAGLTASVNSLLTLCGRRPDWAIDPPDLSSRCAWCRRCPTVNVEGARGNREIEEMVNAGVSGALQHYDRLVAPRTLARVSQDPRRRG